MPHFRGSIRLSPYTICNCILISSLNLCLLSCLAAVFQSDADEDLLDDERLKSPFGSSFRTFDATDYKPIGRDHDY